MSDLPAPTASRLRAPSWRDSRLLVGVLLVLVSTVAGAVVVARADERVPVFAAASPVAPGERVTADDLTVVDVQLGDGAAAYLPADRPLADDTYALRPLRPGELVPAAGVGTAAEVGVQQVALLVDATSAAALSAGSVVDVYVNRPEEGSAGVGCAAAAGAGARAGGRVGGAGGRRRRRAGERHRDPGRAGDGAARGRPRPRRRRRRRRADHPGPRARWCRRVGVVTTVLTAVTHRHEAGFVEVLGAAPALTLVRRCADLAELLSAGAAGVARVAVLSPDLRGLDRDALRHLAGHGVRAAGLVAADDEEGERRLRQLGVGDHPPPGRRRRPRSPPP